MSGNHLFLTFLILIVIGAIIGGMTNAIAIKMLFRPYRPLYIGRFRIPFTPGLIPKRRDELAEQLGKMVMEHLLTAEGIGKRLNHSEFVDRVNKMLRDTIETFLSEEKPLKNYIDYFGSSKQVDIWVKNKASVWMDDFIDQWFKDRSSKKLEELLKPSMIQKIEAGLPKMADHILLNLTAYMESDEGKHKLKQQIEGFLHGRGMFGNMLQLFLGNQSLMEKFHPEIVGFIQRDEFKQVLITLIQKEWDKLKATDVAFIVEKYDFPTYIKEYGKETFLPKLPFDEILRKTPNQLIGEHREMLLDQGVKKVTSMIIQFLSSNLVGILESLDLEDVVKQEVEAFSVERLEEMVLMISKREFKMITFLGALLGGLIGLIQGLLIIVIG